MPELDLREMQPEEAARALHAWVAQQCREFGQKPDLEVKLWTPEEAERLGYSKVWRVSWESGPFEWGAALTMGSSIYAGELCNYSLPAQVLLWGAKHYCAEPHFTFDVGFYPN